MSGFISVLTFLCIVAAGVLYRQGKKRPALLCSAVAFMGAVYLVAVLLLVEGIK